MSDTGETPAEARLVLVTGLSGAGKNSILRALEDVGFEAVDNPPLRMVDTLVRPDARLALGIDARTRDFSAADVLALLARQRSRLHPPPLLIYATAEPTVLLRRYTETRRRHPLAPEGTVSEGIETETALTAPLRMAADWLIDTSDLPLATLRQMIDQRLGAGGPGLAITLVSFGFPAGLPRDADLVFDARFLRNPHYIAELRPKTGLETDVRDYIAADRGYSEYLDKLVGLTAFLLPRFVEEGKKYVTIAIGCTGGRHRSVALVEALGAELDGLGWRTRIEHRALAAERRTAYGGHEPASAAATASAGSDSPEDLRRDVMSGARR